MEPVIDNKRNPGKENKLEFIIDYTYLGLPWWLRG